MKRTFTFFLLIVSAALYLNAQSQFNIESYKSFLESHQNLTAQSLLEMHDAGEFASKVSTIGEPLFYDSVKIKLGLTDYEQSLIEKHGFVVTERISDHTFGSLLEDIYHKDLPVFVSTDAILYAFHSSYDRILKDIELNVLIPTLKDFLNSLNDNFELLESKYDSPEMLPYLKDVDLYLSTALRLLVYDQSCYYEENNTKRNEFINYIKSYNAASIPFFSEVSRKIDFSQFKPRGHYDDQNYPELANYFKTMMWLGRMELYLIAPTSLTPPTKEDVQRQTIMSFLINDLIELAGAKSYYNEIEEFLLFQIGEQDNVTCKNLSELKTELGIESTQVLTDTAKINEFQNLLSTKSYAGQQILSQILIVDPFNPETTAPASSFLMFGQRFIIDSYVTGNVVFDKIQFNGSKIKRMLPETLDILFALGNDAAGQLLTEELEEYKYSSNLAALRYLIDSYDDEYWNKTIYNGWLNSIRELNPPEERSAFPEFMQTAAWWQQKMNTQLAAWSELRHDFILYAKQSYTGGPVCSFPYSYVEPFPEFFGSLKTLAENCHDYFRQLDFKDGWLQGYIVDYFSEAVGTYDTLAVIAGKELTGESLNEHEIRFLSAILSITRGCIDEYNGWYPMLFYKPYETEEGLFKKDQIVVDYHTAPTDEFGSMVGWVKHAGTGPVNLAIITAENHEGVETAFVGPVLSYYELTTTGFTRLTDDEWKNEYLQTANRPDWVNIYLTDTEGESRGSGPSLITSVKEQNSNEELPQSILLAQNYPNPFNGQTLINFSIPRSETNSKVTLKIFDITGREINVLVDEYLSSGNYIARWDATNNGGTKVSSGIYFYRLSVGESFISGKMNYIK